MNRSSVDAISKPERATMPTESKTLERIATEASVMLADALGLKQSDYPDFDVEHRIASYIEDAIKEYREYRQKRTRKA